jgi:outer membrane protein OmpA-like peptidoglycan-associated protein
LPWVSEAVMMKLNEYSRTILFDSGKASSSKRNLSNVAFNYWNLKEYPYSRFLVEGHTDSDGSNEMNQTLSAELQRLKLLNWKRYKSG